MKKFYIILLLTASIFTKSILGMECQTEESILDDVLLKAIQDEEIKLNMPEYTYSFSDDFDANSEPIGGGPIEILSLAFENDNAYLLHYILSQHIPFQHCNLIKRAIKYGSKKMLQTLFHNFAEYKNELMSNQEKWLLKATRDGKLTIVNLFIDTFNFTANKTDQNSLIAHPEIEIFITSEKEESEPHQANYTLEDLFTFIKANNVDKVRAILKLGTIYDLNQYNAEGETLATFAAKYYDDGTITTLLAQYGADLNVPNRMGFTPIITAIAYSNINVIKELIKLDVPLNEPCTNLRGAPTPLIYALRCKNNEAAKEIASQPKAGLNYRDSRNRTALVHAVRTGNDEMISYLISQGANYDSKALALMQAINMEQQEAIKILLDHKADLNYKIEKDKGTYTILEEAAKLKKTKIFKMLLAHEEIDPQNLSATLKTAILEAPSCSYIIARLLRDGADPDMRLKNHEDNITLLMYAARRNYKKIVRMLIEAGADTTLTDNKGRTALMLAAQEGRHHIISELLSAEQQSFIGRILAFAKPGVNNQDMAGNTALTYAALACNPKSIRALMMEGANVHMMNKSGETALVILAKFNEKAIYQKIKSHVYSFVKNPKNWNFTSYELTLHNYRDETFQKSIIFRTYRILAETIKSINDNNPHPLQELKETLKNKSKDAEQREFYINALKTLDFLIQEIEEDINRCCKLILIDIQAITSLNKQKQAELLQLAIDNINLPAIKAFAPHLSKLDKAALSKITQSAKGKKIEIIEALFA